MTRALPDRTGGCGSFASVRDGGPPKTGAGPWSRRRLSREGPGGGRLAHGHHDRAMARECFIESGPQPLQNSPSRG